MVYLPFSVQLAAIPGLLPARAESLTEFQITMDDSKTCMKRVILGIGEKSSLESLSVEMIRQVAHDLGLSVKQL